MALVISAHARGELTAGDAPPPERIEPAWFSLSTTRSTSGFRSPRSQGSPGLPWSDVALIWVIWPTFSRSDMRASRSSARSSGDRDASR
jgi:hypothetical protein